MANKALPKYCRHKGTGQAYVKLDGKRRYLGVYGTPESKKKYARLIAEWQATQTESPTEITIGELTILFLKHAETHYRKNGELTTEVSAIKTAIRHLNKIHRNTLIADFTPKMLRAVRESMIDADFIRASINKHIDRIRRIYEWAVSEGLVSVVVYQTLLTLKGLQKGRTRAREGEPVKPVPDALVDAIQPHVRPVVWAMIELQRATGMRPGEALIMRGCDLNTSGSIWEYVPESHKTEHHDKSRMVMIGPRGQVILKPFLRTNLAEYLFSAKGDGVKHYGRDSYLNAVKRACERAFRMPDRLRLYKTFIKRQVGLDEAQREELKKKILRERRQWHKHNSWCPSQLRHNFATAARRVGGIEAARVSLGHSSAVTSEIYAERDMEAARAIAAKIG